MFLNGLIALCVRLELGIRLLLEFFHLLSLGFSFFTGKLFPWLFIEHIAGNPAQRIHIDIREIFDIVGMRIVRRGGELPIINRSLFRFHLRYSICSLRIGLIGICRLLRLHGLLGRCGHRNVAFIILAGGSNQFGCRGGVDFAGGNLSHDKIDCIVNR